MHNIENDSHSYISAPRRRIVNGPTVLAAFERLLGGYRGPFIRRGGCATAEQQRSIVMSKDQTTSKTTSNGARPRIARTRVARWAWLAAGWFCFTVAVIGIALPGLPTTGPLLLALACFARGSERVHSWLLNHSVFGPPLRRWQEQRIIPLRAKITAVTMMVLSFAYVALLAPLPTSVVILVGVLIVVGISVVLWFPHRPPEAPLLSKQQTPDR